MSHHQEPEGGLGRRLRRLRSQRGLSQSELARRLGLTQSAVSRIESGERQLSAAQLIRWAEILDVDLATVAESEEAMFEQQAVPSAGPGQAVFAAEPAELARLERIAPRLAARPSPDVATWSSPRLLARDAAPAESSPAWLPAEGATVLHGTVRSPARERRGVPQQPGLEPAVFAEVVADALYLEGLAARHGLPPASRASWVDRRVLGPLSPDPAQSARFWRHELGVGVEGPLPDAVVLLEEAGVHVVHARLDGDVPAGACAEVASPVFTVRPTGFAQGPPASSAARSRPAAQRPLGADAQAALLMPFVFVNGARPVVLQRFALAHEFAHLALGHRDAYDERIDWSGRSGREVAANAFAEEFLAPVAAVGRWIETRREREIDVDVVVDLANHFGVSFWAARYRLRAAGRLPGRRLRGLDDSLRRQEWQLIPRQTFLGGLRDTLSVLTAESHSEAGPSANLLRMAPLKVRVPARMRVVALELLQRGVLSLEQAATLLRFDLPSLREQVTRLGL